MYTYEEEKKRKINEPTFFKQKLEIQFVGTSTKQYQFAAS